MEELNPNQGLFNLNLFEDEEKNRENLIKLLGPVGFNNSKEIDPWDDKLNKKDEKGIPGWANMGFY